MQVIDVLTIRNVRFAYNVYGIYASHWVSNVRVSGLWGYINQLSLLTLRPEGVGQYDWVVEGVSSQSDGWAASAVTPGSVIDILTYQDVVLSDVVLEPSYHNQLAPTPLVALDVQSKGDATGEWYRGHVVIRNLRVGGVGWRL